MTNLHSIGQQLEKKLIEYFGIESDALVDKIVSEVHYKKKTVQNYFSGKPTKQFFEQLKETYSFDFEKDLISADFQLNQEYKFYINDLDKLVSDKDLKEIEEVFEFANKFGSESVAIDFELILLRVRYNCNENIKDDLIDYIDRVKGIGSNEQIIRGVSETVFILIASDEIELAISLINDNLFDTKAHSENVDQEVLAFYHNQKGRLHRIKGEPNLARKEFRSAIDFTTEPSRLWKEITNIALTYMDNGKPNSLKESIKYHKEAIEVVKDTEHTHMIARSYNNIACALIELNKFEDASDMLKIAFENIDGTMSFGNLLNIYDSYMDLVMITDKIERNVIREMYNQIVSGVDQKKNLVEYKKAMGDIIEKLFVYYETHYDGRKMFLDKLLELRDRIDNNISFEVRSKIDMVYAEYYRRGVIK